MSTTRGAGDRSCGSHDSTLSYTQLIDAAYGENIYVDDRTIDSHVKRIRKKFRTVDDTFNHIETLYGIGYRYKEH